MTGPHVVSLALEEGFLGDRVRVTAGGRDVADLAGVSTRVQVGLAQTLDIRVQPGEQVLVELPDKHISATVPMPASPPNYVGVSVVDGHRLTVRSGDGPPGYA